MAERIIQWLKFAIAVTTYVADRKRDMAKIEFDMAIATLKTTK